MADTVVSSSSATMKGPDGGGQAFSLATCALRYLQQNQLIRPVRKETILYLLTIRVDMLKNQENAFESNAGRAAREQIHSGHGGHRNHTFHAGHNSSKIEPGCRIVCGL